MQVQQLYSRTDLPLARQAAGYPGPKQHGQWGRSPGAADTWL